MDFNSQQIQEINDIQAIEKQIASDEQPHILTENVEVDRSTLKNLLASFGIIVVGGAAILLIFISFPSVKKKLATVPSPKTVDTTMTIPIASDSAITVQTEYTNPFDAKTQYENPFLASRNPFDNITQ